jgi:hypothetical protein
MSVASTARRLVVILEPDEFQHLAQLADRDTRTPDQQAAYIVRRTLRRAAVAQSAPASREAPDARS